MNSAIYAKTGKRIPEDILQDFILGKEVSLPFDVKAIIERQLIDFLIKLKVS
jgi:Zn-dependent oligopeptidase